MLGCGKFLSVGSEFVGVWHLAACFACECDEVVQSVTATCEESDDMLHPFLQYTGIIQCATFV